MSENPQKRAGWSVARGAGVGFVVGVLIPCVGMFPEFAKRLQWAHGGGGGESAEWGEPLFYMVMLGIPAGLIGAIVGAFLVAAIRWIVKHK